MMDSLMSMDEVPCDQAVGYVEIAGGAWAPIGRDRAGRQVTPKIKVSVGDDETKRARRANQARRARSYSSLSPESSLCLSR